MISAVLYFEARIPEIFEIGFRFVNFAGTVWMISFKLYLSQNMSALVCDNPNNIESVNLCC